MSASIKRTIHATGLLTLLLASGAGWAQITPGQVTDTLKRPTELKTPPPASVIEKAPASPAAAPATGGKTLQVSQFEFSGNTVFSQDQLAALVSGYLNRPISLGDLYAAADSVSDFYAAKGYTLASVNVPPQKISGGTVKLEVSEGVIGDVNFEGTGSYKPEQLARYLGQVKPGRLYQGSDLETGMRQLNEVPGVKARAVVRPGKDGGTTDLVVKVEEKTISGSLFVDNYGTEQVGEFRVAANVVVNNAVGAEDQLNILALRSENNLLTYGSIAYSLPLNFRGSRLLLSYGKADFEVPASAEGSSDNGKIAIDYPLVRTRHDQLSFNVGVSRTNSEAFINGTNLLVSGTSITLFEVGAAYNHVYGNAAVTQVTLNLASNFDKAETVAEARPVAAKAQSADQLLRAELDLQHLQPLPQKFFALLHANGAWSPDPLSNVTQYSIGGPQSIRGYAASELRGDRGYFGQITLGRNFHAGPVQLTGRLFADSGRVLCAVTAPDCTENSLSSGGVGADLQFSRVSAKLDYSHPIGAFTPSDGRNDGRLFGALFVSF